MSKEHVNKTPEYSLEGQGYWYFTEEQRKAVDSPDLIMWNSILFNNTQLFFARSCQQSD